MQKVIYADVLVISNIYITYFLLRSTALLSKKNPDRLRLFVACILGGAYALTVLLPERVQNFFSFFRFTVAVIFILVAFGYGSLKGFCRLYISFLLCNFIFAGLMFALWYFVCPEGMYFNGSVVYFDIDILTLAVLTVVCYAFIKIFEKLFKSRAPLNTVFDCTVYFQGGEQLCLKAFLDSGNRLCDYFTSSPVIISQRGKFADIFPESFMESCNNNGVKMRFILCDTVAGKELLPSFTADKVRIKGAEHDFFAEKITVALTERKILQGEYDAILPMGLFENDYLRKDEREIEKNTVAD